MLIKSTIIAAALSLAGCQTIAAPVCDIHRVDPPQHYLDAGRQQLVLTVIMNADQVQARCEDTPVGCVLGFTDLGGGVRVWSIAVVDDPSPWGMTRQQVEDHETAHVGGWNRCHNN